MKILILCGDNPNQVAFANKLAQNANVAGIVVEKKSSFKKKNRKFSYLLERILDRSLFLSIRKAWINLQDYYRNKFPEFPDVDLIHVENINSKTSVQFINRIQPDLIVVSGTRIIRKPVLELKPTYGIVNLHTGLSPYIKGGPNCTNWCISLNKFDLIGNTIMWIDAGIDSGNIITTEQTDLTGDETLFELHLKVMEHAHELYIRAIKKIEEETSVVKSIPQNTICEGVTYYTRDWNCKAKLHLIKNFKHYPERLSGLSHPKTVSL